MIPLVECATPPLVAQTALFLYYISCSV